MHRTRMFRAIVLGGVALVAGSACNGETETTGTAKDAGGGDASSTGETAGGGGDSGSGGDPCGHWMSCECPDGHFACEYACLVCRRVGDTGTDEDSTPPIPDAADASPTKDGTDGDVDG